MVGAILLLFCGIKYYNKSKAVRSYQVLITDLNRLQTAQNVVAGLLSETMEYSKTHPEINPTLEAIGIKPGAKPALAPAPTATKPATK